MADLTDEVLQYVNKLGCVDTLDIAKEIKDDHQKIIGAVKSIQSFGEVSYVDNTELYQQPASAADSDSNITH